ncbi:MAG: phosphoribosylaminoimidazolecarboxamide formyltransferase/IMP cyclohydrolase [Pseudomonadota bacterium]
MIRRALLSVHDKTGLVELAQHLAGAGVTLVASGGTARALRAAGLEVVEVSDMTGAPEILGGRVKTLHPAVHGGILARRTDEHLQELAQHNIEPIDLVVCNLYPFAATVAAPGVTEADAIEQIDIGGVTLLRAAAKNFESVVVLVDAADHGAVLASLHEGGPDLPTRRALALKAFRHTAAYDAAIAGYLGAAVEGADTLPQEIQLSARLLQPLRYGENPHQRAALYQLDGQAWPFEQLQGKELSYNNIVDLVAAWEVPQSFPEPCCAIIKHTNPCGLAVADTLTEAFRRALSCDPVSAFGSIIAVNGVVDIDFAVALAESKLFVEVLVAPEFTEEALARLERRKQCRVMRARAPKLPGLSLRSVHGGLLVQSPDQLAVDSAAWKVATLRPPTAAELAQLDFAWRAVKHVKSNAIVFARDFLCVGVGAGQMNRVDSVRIAASRAGDRAVGAVVASDAFFPFPDGVEAAAAAGVTGAGADRDSGDHGGLQVSQKFGRM